MISDKTQAALEALRGLGWKIQLCEQRRPLPDVIDKRYPSIPSSLRAFLEHVETCERGDERVWFLTATDYARTTPSPIAWDEWERMDQDKSDPATIAQSRAFWDAHLPILQSIEGDYAYLAVCVDVRSRDYGRVFEGYAPDFLEPSKISGSFDALLEDIARVETNAPDSDLAAFFLHPHHEKRLPSTPPSQGIVARLLRRIRAIPLFESYRVGVVVENKFSRPLWAWENWSEILPPLNAVMKGLSAEAVIRPRQAGDNDNWLGFGRLPWNEKSNRTWTTKYLTDLELAGKVHFVANEVWAPSRAISFETRRGPELFSLLDYSEVGDTQGFVLAIRKDVLRRVDLVADDVIFSVREFFGPHKIVVFDRRWGQHGRFGSLIVDTGLDWTGSGEVLHWATSHPKSHVRSFRWRKSMG